jgi:hypothetical protein
MENSKNIKLFQLLLSVLDKPIRFSKSGFNPFQKELKERSLQYTMYMEENYSSVTTHLKRLEAGSSNYEHIEFLIKIKPSKDFLEKSFKALGHFADLKLAYNPNFYTDKESEYYNADVARFYNSLEKEFDKMSIYLDFIKISTIKPIDYKTIYKNEVLESIEFDNIIITILN